MNRALSIFKTSLVSTGVRLRPSFVALRASYEDEPAEILTMNVPENSHLEGNFLTVNLHTFSADKLLRSFPANQIPFPILGHPAEKMPLQEPLY